MLTDAQREAIDFVQNRAGLQATQAADRTARWLHEPSISTLSSSMLETARLTTNFHPDRMSPHGTVIESLSATGEYQSQFITKISNGGLSAYKGGDRFKWEALLFGGAYNDAADVERPCYGGLDVWHQHDGACPRFGSCVIVWSPSVKLRATYSWQDSVTSPEHVGTATQLDDVASILIDTLGQDGSALGHRASLNQAVTTFTGGLRLPTEGRALDDYIEAQIHGRLTLADADALLMDPSFVGTESYEHAQTAAKKFGLKVLLTRGYSLHADDFPDDLRGEHIPRFALDVARRFTVDHVLTAHVLGLAARNIVIQPDAWAEWGDSADGLQWVKYLWHIAVLKGEHSTNS